MMGGGLQPIYRPRARPAVLLPSPPLPVGLPGRANLVLVDLAGLRARHPSLALVRPAWVHPDEWLAADALQEAHRREQYVAGRLAARLAVSRFGGRRPRLSDGPLRSLRSSGRTGSLQLPVAWRGVHVGISHVADTAVGVAASFPVGIDLAPTAWSEGAKHAAMEARVKLAGEGTERVRTDLQELAVPGLWLALAWRDG